MKKFKRQILIFGLLILIGYPVILFVFHLSGIKITNSNPYALRKDHLYMRLDEAIEVKDIDILFLGSSHAYRGFDPRIFKEHGYKTFNLGSSAQTPRQTLILVKKYIEQLNPKLVVLEANPMFLSYEGMESTLDFIRNSPTHDLKANMTWDGLNMLSFNSYLVSIMSNFTSLGEEEVKVGSKDTYINGGFVERKLKFNQPSKFKENINTQLVEGQVKNFNNILDETQKKGTNYLIVEAPVTRQFYNLYEREPFMEVIGDKPFINFNNLMNLDDSLNFYDAHHMNMTGVKQFNELLIKKIATRKN